MVEVGGSLGVLSTGFLIYASCETVMWSVGNALTTGAGGTSLGDDVAVKPEVGVSSA